MKVMAISSSPRGSGQSKTELMLGALVKGMQDAGAEVEEVFLRNKKIKNCIGCFTCWTKTPGKCALKDDMTAELYPKFITSDMAVFATPLYHYTMNATLKAFIERTLPVLEPLLVVKGERTYHPLRGKHPAIIMLSVAGFPEQSVFNQLSNHVRFMYAKGLLAEIYRGGVESMTSPYFKEIADDILEAITQAGRELVKTFRIAPETMARITQPICDFTEFALMANLMWKACIAEGITPKEFLERGMVPRPDSIETFLIFMKTGFNPQAAAGMKAIVQFVFTGELDGSCYIAIENGKIKAKAGPADKPDLTIAAPFGVWMDIITRKANGGHLFRGKKYRAEGDLNLLMDMNKLFAR